MQVKSHLDPPLKEHSKHQTSEPAYLFKYTNCSVTNHNLVLSSCILFILRDKLIPEINGRQKCSPQSHQMSRKQWDACVPFRYLAGDMH